MAKTANGVEARRHQAITGCILPVKAKEKGATISIVPNLHKSLTYR